MKMSTKSRYAVRCMAALAETEQKISVTEISSQQDISERYLELIFAQLKKAGLVMSIRGSKGGYQLITPADKITVYDIINAMENDMNIVKESENPSPMESILNEQLWLPANQNIQQYLKSITLQTLLDDHTV